MAQKVRKAVIAAAGFGTRFLPQTKAMPKEMLPIVDKPIIQYVVEELVSVGIEDIVIVTGYSKRSIEDHFDMPNQDLVNSLQAGGESKQALLKDVVDIANMANFAFIRQKEPLGNAAPLLYAEHLVGDEPFLFTWSDDFVVSSPTRFQQIIDAYNEFGCSIVGTILAEEDADFDRYGYAAGEVVREGAIDLRAFIEKPGKAAAPSSQAANGGFLITPDFFPSLHARRQEVQPPQELVTSEVLRKMVEDGNRVIALEIKDAKYYDAGNKLEYIKTVIDFALQHDDIADDMRAYLKQKASQL